MKTKTAGQPGNNKSGIADGLIKGPAAPTVGQTQARENENAISVPASAPVYFEKSGEKDIVFVLNDGQVICYEDTPLGRINSNYFFESYPKTIFSIHFGESCYYVRNGKIGAQVEMTRGEFWRLVQVAVKAQVAG